MEALELPADAVPAQEPRHRHGGVRRHAEADRRRRLGDRPALVQELVAARRAEDPLAVLTPREREVLALMAEGRSNAGIARHLWVTEGTVEKHLHSILGKLRLPETGEDHRRVLAVIAVLDAH